MTYASVRSRRFILAAQGLTKDAEAALSDRLTETNCGWWHWIPGVWLVVDQGRGWSTESLRDFVLQYVPGGNVIALELSDPGNWSVSAPQEGLEWMRDTWT